MRPPDAPRRFLMTAVSFAIALLLSSAAYAGPDVWTTGGPYGGTILSLAIDPVSPANVYAGTYKGVYRSADSGATWVAANAGVAHLTVNAMAIDPSNPATIYAGGIGGQFGGVYKSTDSGGIWVAANNGLSSLGVLAMAIDPINPATLYIGTYDGVFKSTNAGGTWAPAHAGLMNSIIHTLAIDPINPATLYAGTDSWIQGGESLFKSTNGGDSWTPVSPTPPSATRLSVALAIDPTNPTTIYAGERDRYDPTAGGVFVSTNAGGTWAAVSSGLTNLDVRALVVDPLTPTTIYAGTYGGGIFKSTSSGGTWSPVNTGLTNPAVNAVAIDPVMPSTIYAGTLGGGFKSADSGGLWAEASSGLTNMDVLALVMDPMTQTTLYAGTYGGGIFKSTNSGETWAHSGLPDLTVRALAIDPTTPSILYAATDGGLFRSVNSGVTWVPAGGMLAVQALAIDPSTPSTLYAGSFPGGVQKSTNSGATWVPSGLAGLDVLALAIDPTTPATVYAGTRSGVYKSVNSGGTWVAANSGLTSLAILALAIDPANPATLYVGLGNGGVFKSTNSGGIWVNAGLTNRTVGALSIDPTAPANLYAGTTVDGVFASFDSGGTWGAVNRGLPTWPTVHALALDPSGPTTVYAGLSGSGVWQATPPTRTLDANLRLTLSDSPDPVTATAPLTYTVDVVNDGPGPATFLVVSLLQGPHASTFDGAAGAGWSCGGAQLQCTRPGLAVGAATQITFQFTPGPLTTSLFASAFVTAAETDPDLGNNGASEGTTVNPPLVWLGTRTKTVLADSGSGFVAGQGVTYTITLRNAGSAAQADNPGHEFVDVLPTSLTLISASATSGDVALDLAGNSVSWDGSIPSGATAIVTIHATIKSTVPVGTTVANQGTIHSDADANGTNDATTRTDDPASPGANDPTTFIVAPLVIISVESVLLHEGDVSTTDAVFTVRLSRTSTLPVSVGFATADGTATAGADYVATTGTLTFPPGATQRTVTVPVTGDTIVEGIETFLLGLHDAVNAEVIGPPATATILDDDPILHVSLTGTGTGVVTSVPAGIQCGQYCSSLFDQGTVVTLTAAANPGTTFEGWGGACSGIASTCQVTMDTTRFVTASFRGSHQLIVTKAGIGRGTVVSAPPGIDCGTDCTETYPHGTIVLLTAAPSSGSRFVRWEGAACVATELSCPVSMTEFALVTAVFDLVAEPVGWERLVATRAVGSTLWRPTGTGWNAGAVSSKVLASGDGYAEYTVSWTLGSMFGLSHGDSDASYADIDYALFAQPYGLLLVIEKGEYRGTFGGFGFGDRLRVSVEHGAVTYRRNGDLLYTSATAPTYPLLVDTSLNTTGTAIFDAAIAGHLEDRLAPADVFWRDMAGASAEGSTLQRDGDVGWNAGGVSAQELVSGDGYSQYRVAEPSSYVMFGLGHGDTDQGYADVDFGLLTHPPSGKVLVFEQGQFRAILGSYQTGDILRVGVENGVVSYSVNGVAMYVSTAQPTYPLLTDTSLYSANATVQDARMGGELKERVTWTHTDGVTPLGDALVRESGTGWNAGAVSSRQIASGDGGAEYVVADLSTLATFGLSNGDTDASLADVDYAVLAFPVTKQLLVFEKGVYRGQFGTYAVGDRLRVSVQGNVVSYWRNGTLLYSSTAPPVYPLLLDTSIYQGRIAGARLTGNVSTAPLLDDDVLP